ncbi:hypothetical protein R3P38DRAFT_2783841 [Favolaschia claudopus]|uniref:DUF6532 domain-containing protein n=1 Tax=Favolaschia claudopus TaxID=2862362 RepID=A0AAW0AZQ7_9AGAR
MASDDSCRRRNVEGVDNSQGDDTDTDTDADDDDDDDDDKKKKKRTKKDPSSPRVWGFYPKPWVFVFQQVKDRKFIYLLNIDLFPDYETIEGDLSTYFTRAIARGHKRGLKLEEVKAHTFTASDEESSLRRSWPSLLQTFAFELPLLPLKLMYDFKSNLRKKCKEEAVNVFNIYYAHLIHLTEDDYALLGDPPNQQAEIEAKIEKVKNVLLFEGRYHLDGKDKNGKTNNFMHEALGNLALRIQKIGKKPLYKDHSNKFQTYTPRFIAACATLLRCAIDEYGKTGSHKKVKFSKKKYLGVYNKIVFDLQTLEDNDYHWQKTTARWQRWADAAQKELKMDKQNAVMVGNDEMRVVLD